MDRCPYAGAPAAVVAQHSYRVAASHEGLFHKLKSCACSEHTPLSRQSLDELGEYPYSLALVLARRMVSCVCEKICRWRRKKFSVDIQPIFNRSFHMALHFSFALHVVFTRVSID